MTAVSEKTRYAGQDQQVYAGVLFSTEVESCFPEGMPRDPLTFRLACIEATKLVPLNDGPRGAWAREAYARQRLLEAIQARNKWYRENVRAP